MHHPIGLLASRPVLAVEAVTPALDALRLMSAQGAGRVVVLEESAPVGILTERDVVFTANWVVGQPSLRIREVVSKPVLTAAADLTLDDACQLFRDGDVRHLVVLGARMELAGLFTHTDLVRALKHTFFAGIPTVAALMSRRVLRVTADVSARHTLALMASHSLSGVVVVEGERPVGVFAEHDAVRLVAAGSDLASLAVGAVMTAPALTIPAAAAPARAIDLMHDHAVRRLVVVDDHGLLAGILTLTDLGRVFERQEEPLCDGFQRRSHETAASLGSVLH
jgi:CBS domain-containing protein